MKIVRSRKRTDSIMANQGFGPCVVIRKGENKLKGEELSVITLEEAMRLLDLGVEITVA